MRYAHAILFIWLAGACINGISEELPRGPNGNPDLNGVWQVLNTANYDLEACFNDGTCEYNSGCTDSNYSEYYNQGFTAIHYAS